jgi:uncharacterized membrane protein (GlpM family)
MTEAESLRRFRPADNTWSVRGGLLAALLSALLAGLLTPVWLFALVTHYVVLARPWELAATMLAAIALVTGVANMTLHVRFASRLSLRGAWVSGLCVLVIGAEWLVVWLWTWTGYC